MGGNTGDCGERYAMANIENKSNREKMSAGEFYNPADAALVRDRIRTRALVDRYNRTRAWNFAKRNRIIKRLVPDCGRDFYFEPTIRLEYGYNLSFGDNFYMNYDCQLLDVGRITIGDNVMFGPGVIVATPMHPFLADERIVQEYEDGAHDWEYSREVNIGDNVWIAAGAVVCGGVNIGDNTIIAAGSVVTKDIPSNVIAAGVPCRVIRALGEGDRILEKHGITPFYKLKK